MSRREELRKKRLEVKAAEESREKKMKVLLLMVAVIGFAAISLIAVVALQNLGQEEEPAAKPISLRGIPQQGLSLGSPDAPVKLLEWGDLQCPACAEFARGELSEIIKEEVRPGRVQIEFRHWPIVGGSSEASRAALAASLQNRMWEFIEIFYSRQDEASPDQEFLEEIAREAGVPDIERWRQDIDLPRWSKELLRNDEEAISYDFSGTPAFLIDRGQGPEVLLRQRPGDVLQALQK